MIVVACLRPVAERPSGRGGDERAGWARSRLIAIADVHFLATDDVEPVPRSPPSGVYSTPGNALTPTVIHLHVDTHPGTQIWDLKTYKLKTDLPGHTDEVYCVDFVADKLVSGGRDRTVKM